MMLVIRAGLRGVTGAIDPGPPLQGGPREEIYLFGAIDPGPPLQGGPREEIYLFQIKYSVKNFS